MSETRKLAAILVADVVGYSRLAGADEDRTLARLRALRSDLIDPTIALHHGRVVKRTGDGSIIEFRSVVDAVRCAIEVQTGMVERNTGLPPEKRIDFRIGIHLGDIVEESDGDLMGDGLNIAARLEGIAKPGAICLSEDAYRQVKQRLDLKVTDLGATQLKNIAQPVRVYSLEVGQPAEAKPPLSGVATVKPGSGTPTRSRWSSRWLALAALVLVAAGGWTMLGGRLAKPAQAAHLSIVALPFANLSGDPSQDYFADGITENLTTDLSRIRGSFVIARNTALLRRRDRRIPQGARRRLASLHALRQPRRRIRARRQDGRGEVRLGGSPPSQSQSHRQVGDRAFAERAEGVRRPAQGGAAGGVSDIRAGDIGWANGSHPPK
jgi:adenylate cyclase